VNFLNLLDMGPVLAPVQGWRFGLPKSSGMLLQIFLLLFAQMSEAG
jgi:hypothetical protein